MTTQSQFPLNDLVLRLTGGQRDGEFIPVKTQKCFLGSDESAVDESSEHPQCAIFRGPNGAAVRSYADDISVNGIATTVHWLKEGDRIEFPNSMTVEVTQLGWIDASSNLTLAPEFATQPDTELPNADQGPEVDAVAEEPNPELHTEPSTNAESFHPATDSDSAVAEIEPHNTLPDAAEETQPEGETDPDVECQDFVDDRDMEWVDSADSAHDSYPEFSELDDAQPGDDFEPESGLPAFDGDDEPANELNEPADSKAQDSPTEVEAIVDDPNQAQDIEPLADANAEEATEEPVSNPESHPAHHEDARLDAIESQLHAMQSQSRFTEERFGQFESQMTTITEQIDQLVALASESSSLADRSQEPQDVDDAEPSNLGLESVTDESVDSSQDDTDAYDDAAGQSELFTDSNQDEEDSEPATSGELYSYLNDNDDDEKIMTFDADEESELSADANDEITDPRTEDSHPHEDSIDSRLSEMERVFGSELGRTEPESTPSAEETCPPTNEENSADEQPFESFTPPTHGQDVESVSSAETPPTESVEPIDSIVPGSLASQLLSEVLSEESESAESETDSNLESQAESTDEEIEEPAPPAASVADLLAKMKEEGEWDGIPECEQDEETPEHVLESPPSAVHVPVEPAPAHGEHDVNDYMSRLLNRMRGTDEPEPQPEEPVDTEETKQPESEETTEVPTFVAPKNPLRPEEFIPARKAQRIELGAMRELANSTSRQAVQASEQGKLKELGYMQIGIASCSFLIGIYFLLSHSQSLFDSGFLVGLTCIGIAGFLGYRFYSTMKYNELMVLRFGGEPKTDKSKTDSKVVAGKEQTDNLNAEPAVEPAVESAVESAVEPTQEPTEVAELATTAESNDSQQS